MKFDTIVFTYTGEVGKNYGIDGKAIIKEGVEFTPDNLKDDKIAKIWINEGFAKLKGEEEKPKEQIKYEDVPKEELKAELAEETDQPEILPVEKVRKKRGRKPKNK